jgi:uncharacterized membrane protein YphA (DoxX/SURF4 family)
MQPTNRRNRRKTILLWTAQTLLAALFLVAGIAKLTMPVDALEAQSGMPGVFLQFIAVCELLGAAGLILPGVFRIHEGLTPLAAAGLTIIMAGAVTTSVASIGMAAAIGPLVIGIVAATVAHARWDLTHASLPSLTRARTAH